MNYAISKLRVFVVFLFTVAFLLSSVKNVNAERPVYNSNKNSSEKIAITFDDGPHPIRTLKLLDILNRYNVKATFFVVGQNVENYPHALSEIVKNGHEIANHTFSHKLLKNHGYEYIEKEIKETEKSVIRCGGKIEKMIRPPCGIFDENLLKLASKEGYKIILWNIDTHDWANESGEKIVSNILKNVSGGDIILFHDYTSGENHTHEALEKIIPILQKKGFELVTVSQLLQ